MPKQDSFVPHPDRVLINIKKQNWDELFYKWIDKDDGTRGKLFTALEANEGYDERFTQNVSIGHVVAIGSNIKGIFPGDVAILDYLVSNDNDTLVGVNANGDKLVSIPFKTTYHDFDATPNIDGRKAFVKGDYDVVSPLMGVVRRSRVIAFPPFVFLVHKSNLIITKLPNGRELAVPERISEREILAAPASSEFKGGDTILIKEIDMFSRFIDGKELSVCFHEEIICKKTKLQVVK